MRQEISLNKKWVFHEGDIEVPTPAQKGPVYTQSKTVRKQIGPAAYGYVDTPDQFSYDSDVEMGRDKWEFADLPHDYVITQTPNPENNNSLGFFEYNNAWYRKHFTLPELDGKNKRILIYFEGVAGKSTVYLNGCLMKHNFSAYNSFCIDISDTVYYDKENVLAVYIDRSEFEGWWYQGGGIYRNVKLIITEPLAVDLYGVYAPAIKNDDENWEVNFETTVVNADYEDKTFTVQSEILNADGSVLAKAETKGAVALREKTTVKYTANVKNPKLWDCENPNLYTVKTCVFEGKTLVDTVFDRIGFRTIELSLEKGFLLNGKSTYIKGVCSHQDFGLTGIAVPDNVAKYKIKLIKEMGANGFRTSHYQNSAAVMDALDELGFIVMDETRWFESTEEGLEQLSGLVLRDRNRPSVVFWSTGNEEPHHSKEEGGRIHRALAAQVRKLDNTRFVMTAQDRRVMESTVFDDCDLVCINYNLQNYDALHEKYPNKLILASECCATGTTRGWHIPSNSQGRIRDMDRDTSTWFKGRELTFKHFKERPWVIGFYQWAAVEHRGEAVWPQLCSKSGAIDLYLQKKGAFYQNKSHWTQEPMVHIVPHWNFKGLEGKEIAVPVYNNCETVELFLNGESLGEQAMEKYSRGLWNVPFVAGELKCVGKIGGEVVATDTVKTTGEPQKLRLKKDLDFKANGEDIGLFTCYCVDENGEEVRNATPVVEFSVSEGAVVVATGSDNCDTNPVTETKRRMYGGKISIAVKANEGLDKLELYAQSENLGFAVIDYKF